MLVEKLLKKLLWAMALVVFAFVCFVGYLINLMINRPMLGRLKELKDESFTQFWVKNENGHKINAMFYPGKPENGVVVLCHGHGVAAGNLDDMVPFLKKAGVGILLFDFRAHGKSEGRLCTIGLHEHNDIKQVLKAAKDEGLITDNTKVAAYGRSMGAASLINGSAGLSEVDAFILESSFEELRKIAARDARHNVGVPDTFLIDLTFWVVEKITSVPYLQNKPVEKIAGIGSRPTMLIHDELDHRANEDAFAALHAALPAAQTFVASGARHVQAHKIHEAEFERLFLQFLKDAAVIKSE
jgi:pimeloyl-ACP methyl ester carboxylesterase